MPGREVAQCARAWVEMERMKREMRTNPLAHRKLPKIPGAVIRRLGQDAVV